jgi:hypothetical protein
MTNDFSKLSKSGGQIQHLRAPPQLRDRIYPRNFQSSELLKLFFSAVPKDSPKLDLYVHCCYLQERFVPVTISGKELHCP